MENKASVKITGDSSSLNAATNQADKGLEKLGVTAKQTAAAMRGVPAQFTDIITSLQGGQAPITVLFQQGGQLKDMFGGVGNAARALSGYVIGLINPFTLTAAAAGTLGAAFFYGSEQSKSLENALIISGNVAGQTSGQLETLAETLGETTGHYTQSREAVEALASSGVISGKSIESALKGVLSLSELTGESVDKLVPKFEEIARDPVKAIVKLNEQYNFLTLDIYKQIKALEEQGKKTEAAQLATETFANALEGRKDQVLDNIGYFESAWIKVKSAIDSAKDSFLGFGREASLDEKISDIESKLSARVGRGGQFAVARDKGETRDVRGRSVYVPSEYEQLTEQLTALNKQKQAIEAKAKADSDRARKDKEAIAAAEEASSRKTKKTKDPLNSDRESLGQLQRENELLAQGFSLQESQTIAKLEAKGANQALIVSILDANEAQANYVESMKAADDAEKSKLKSLQDEITFETQLKEATEKRAYEQEQAAAKLKKQKEETFDSLNDQYLKANQELEADLISSDVKREKRRAEIAHEYALKRIEDEKLSAEQTAALREKEAENYEKTLQKIESEASKTKNLGAELGLTFASTFEDAIVKGGSFGDLISSLGQDIERVITRMLVIEPLIKNLKSAMEDSGGAGGIFGGILGSIGSIFTGGSSDLTGAGVQNYADGVAVSDVFGGGRASGGAVSAGRFYEVNENAPELLTTGGKTYLMMGGESGNVTPPKGASFGVGSNGGTGLNVQVNLIETSDKQKQGQLETSQDGNNKTLNIFIEKIKASIANDISRGTGISSALEQTYALNRAAGAR